MFDGEVAVPGVVDGGDGAHLGGGEIFREIPRGDEGGVDEGIVGAVEEAALPCGTGEGFAEVAEFVGLVREEISE